MTDKTVDALLYTQVKKKKSNYKQTNVCSAVEQSDILEHSAILKFYFLKFILQCNIAKSDINVSFLGKTHTFLTFRKPLHVQYKAVLMVNVVAVVMLIF